MAGNTYSTDFPTTSGAYNTFLNGSKDVFVSKFNSGLTNLLASTFLGGSGDDTDYSFALDTSGDVYVAGYTYSTDFPTTSGAYDTSYNGSGDIFISKLNSGLTSLVASTYLGGSGVNGDNVNFLTLDTNGNVYVTGKTYSTDFPTTSGAYDTSQNGIWDVFVSKLDGGLTSLLASTYLGGSGNDSDEWHSLTLDTSGNVYVTGETQSTDFPTTSGAYDTSYNGGKDVFVSKLNSGLTSLLASTYLGGSSDDEWHFLTLDTSGNVYVMGRTGSRNFPTTSGAYDTSFNGNVDVFVSKLNSGLTSLLASTYLGGSGNDTGYSLTLDASGDVYVTGQTGSTNFPTTSGAYDTSYNGGDYSGDVFVSKLDGNLSANIECMAESITAAPKRLTLRKGKDGDVAIAVKGSGDCPVEGITVTATINGKGKRLIDVSPSSQKTDANGQAVFAITAKDKKGTAVLQFKASGLDEVATVQVKVR